jgi:Zn-dependent protease
MPSGFLNVLLLVPTFLFSLSFHEYAHAWVATRKGDRTALNAGRLSLHPMAHADWVGTLLLPIICIYNGWPFFGWAKPVPVDSRNFKNPRRDMALVAAAGPASNVLLAVLSAAWLAVLIRLPAETRLMETLQTFAAVSIQVNLMLAIFNLIPIPPLDGFNILQGVIPKSGALKLARLMPYANTLLILMLLTGGFRIIAYPMRLCYGFLMHAIGVSPT